MAESSQDKVLLNGVARGGTSQTEETCDRLLRLVVCERPLEVGWLA